MKGPTRCRHLIQIAYTVSEEMVLSLSEFFLARRTGLLYFDLHFVQGYWLSALEYFSNRLHWDEDRKKQERMDLEK
jgi:glycerol-3-phosphate dehydrogenase